jgi:hypothetical protein
MTSREIIQLKRDVDAAKNAAHAATRSLATVSDRDAPEWTAYYAKLAVYRQAVAITGYPGFLVICNDDSDQPMARVLATRTVFTDFEKAVDYAKGVSAARDPEIIGCPFALDIVRKIDNPVLTTQIGKYRSCAKWPVQVSTEYPHNVSKDTHDTKEQAEGVCSLLHRDGLGGDRKIFPLQTWVESA